MSAVGGRAEDICSAGAFQLLTHNGLRSDTNNWGPTLTDTHKYCYRWPFREWLGMRRREFIGLFGGAAAGWPLAARAQQPALPVIGFLHPTSPDAFPDRLRGFRQGLKEAGYVEGENVMISYRFAENQIDRLPAMADELVSSRV